MEIIKNGVTQNDLGNLEIPMPLKNDAILPRIKLAIYMRSRNTLKKVANNPTLSSKCCDNMQSYLQAGQVEQLTEPLDLNTQAD